jgi:capsular polysaccharide biosynthesis protein
VVPNATNKQQIPLPHLPRWPSPVSRPPPRPVPTPTPSTPCHKSPSVEVVTIYDDDEYKFNGSFDLETANWDEFDQQPALARTL